MWADLKVQAKAVRGDVCEPCKRGHRVEGCSGRADEAHHMKGKRHQSLAVLLLTGTAHHKWITEHPEEAFALGFSLKRNWVTEPEGTDEQ